MNFQEIPQFTRSANYKVDVMWSTLKGWLAGLEEINLTRQVENAPSKQAAEELRNQRHKFLMMCFSQYEKEDD